MEKITANNLSELAEKGIEVSLQNIRSGRIQTPDHGYVDFEYTLTDDDRWQIAQLLGGLHRTRSVVANQLQYLISMPSHWGFERIYFCKHARRWSYAAGQSYPDEIRDIRKFLSR